MIVTFDASGAVLSITTEIVLGLPSLPAECLKGANMTALTAVALVWVLS
ncbi:hypothetical protein [Variovorax sp. J31P207]|nr:hypothetical protein [Variovorax sp. J31P207]MDM0065995.1 hypothetical protein [Variovorax sp. J31P207]